MTNQPQKTETLASLLNRSTDGPGTVRATEAELIAWYKAEKCNSKAALVKYLYNVKKWSRGDIAVTLLKYNILSPKSYRNHVYNILSK